MMCALLASRPLHARSQILSAQGEFAQAAVQLYASLESYRTAYNYNKRYVAVIMHEMVSRDCNMMMVCV